MPKHKNKNVEQLNKQDDFWYSIIGKYEQRNAELEAETKTLQKDLHKMEAFLPPYLSYKMMVYQHKCPGANVSSLLRSAEFGPVTSAEVEKKIDLGAISVFSIVDNDVFYIDAIDDIVSDGKLLEAEIKRLKAKEEILKETSRMVTQLLEDIPSSTELTVAVDAELLETTNKRLLVENEALQLEKADLIAELHSLHDMEEPMLQALAEQHEKLLELQQMDRDFVEEDEHCVVVDCTCNTTPEGDAACLRKQYLRLINDYEQQVKLSRNLKHIIGTMQSAAREMEAMILRRSNCTGNMGTISIDL